jgi:hypothetical protein
MKILISLALFFITLHSSGSEALTTYKLKLADKWIEGSETRDSQVRTFKIQIEGEQPGFSYVSSRAIAKSLGDKSKADQHPFSFAGPEDVQIEIEPITTHFIFSSFKSTPNGYNARKASQFVVGFADKKLWNQSEFEAHGTMFRYVSGVFAEFLKNFALNRY